MEGQGVATVNCYGMSIRPDLVEPSATSSTNELEIAGICCGVHTLAYAEHLEERVKMRVKRY